MWEFYLCVCLCSEGTETWREEEGAASPFPPELELQMVMSHYVHAGDPAPRSSGRAANVLYHWAIAPVPTQNRI